jgi:endoglucanase
MRVPRFKELRPRAVSCAAMAACLLAASGCIPEPAPIVAGPIPPPPARVQGANPLAGAKLFVDANSNAAAQVRAWRASRPDDAAAIERIASQPHADWFGEWSGDVEAAVDQRVALAADAGAVPLMVVYNVPNRDCGQYSAGGAKDDRGYRTWIRELARGIKGRRVIVVLEPDALGLLTKCLSPADQQARLALLSDAVTVLAASDRTALYLDAGNARWIPAPEMARRLRAAGVMGASGFALNVSNYIATEETVAYGKEVSALLGGKHFVVDTSRNGNGATKDSQWCNPAGRAIGPAPTTNPGDPVVDAFLWVKPPGESDGTCNGGPRAGEWWPEYALGLVKNVGAPAAR